MELASNDKFVENENILATNSRINKEMIELLK